MSESNKDQPGICLSFDDRTIDEWYQMRPLLNQYNAKVTFFVTQFDSLTQEEISKLWILKSEGHEIGSHGAMHVLAEHYIKENSYSKYMRLEIDSSINSMRNANFEPVSFAYPYGASYWFTDYLIGRKFEIIRNVYALKTDEDITLANDIYISPHKNKIVWALGIDVANHLSKEKITHALNRTSEAKKVLMLYGHVPSIKNKKNPYSFDLILLEYILLEAQKRSLKFYLIKELR